MSFDYDLFTIGAGSGGVRASRMAAQYGAKVAIAEEYRIGGTCVIRGCVPKKLMVYASHFSEDFADAMGYGWTVQGAHFDWGTLIANKDTEIERLSQIYRRNLMNAGVEIFETRAVIKDPHTVHLVAQKRDVTAERILIATGGAPVMPAEIEGVEHTVSSNEVFHLKTQPRHITIVGGGYIAVEFTGIFHGLGTQVKLIHHGTEILRTFDRDLSVTLMAEMRRAGVELELSCGLKRVERHEGRFRIFMRDGVHFDTDLVMLAVGRRPNTQGMGLEALGVKLSKAGAVVVDEYSRSNVQSIFAIGDTTARLQLTPIAIREGAAFAESEFNNNLQPVDYENVPTAIFSNPTIGTVGLSEAQALERFGVVDIYKADFRPMKHILAGRDSRMMMKLVVEPKSDRVVGCHLIGPDSGELIQALGIAVKMGATKRDFDATVAVHPTSAEELVLMRTKTRVVRGPAGHATHTA
jgi:glutathione reductase (NADPH)